MLFTFYFFAAKYHQNLLAKHVYASDCMAYYVALPGIEIPERA